MFSTTISGYLYLVLGIIVCPAVVPVFTCLTWKKANRWGALVGMLVGLPIGILAWLVSAYALEGSVTLDTTSADNPLIAGNLIALVFPGIITVVWSLISPEDYSFEGTRAINAPGNREGEVQQDQDSQISTPTNEAEKKDDFASSENKAESTEKGVVTDDEYRDIRKGGLDPVQLQESFNTAFRTAIPLTFILIIFVPCMAIIAKTFSPAGLGAWVGIIIAHMFVSAFIVILLPVYESRVALVQILKGIAGDLTDKRRRVDA